MPRHNNTGRSKGEGRYVALPEYIEQSQAWRELSGTAAKAWLSIGLMFNGSNNGALAVSSRELGSRIGVHHSVAARALLELENAGFLRKTKASSFSQKRRAAEYRLTHRRNDINGDAPSKDFMRPKIAVENVIPLRSGE